MLHQIGNGALGPVFRAYDSDRDRLVAIKVFRLDLPPERVHQLVAEFEQLIAAELQHPLIAAPRATGIDAATNAFLALDFAAAESLDVVLRENGRTPLAKTLRIASQLAEALDYAADRNVLHGALHPRDILLSEDDIRIVGMGVARALERAGITNPVRRPYSAPERVSDEGWDRRADVFGLAAIVYEMLCGRRVAGIGSESAEGLGDVQGCDVTALQTAFALALAADPEYRFATATAFTDALKDAIVPDGVDDAIPDAPGKPKPKRQRSRLRVVADAEDDAAPASPQDEPALPLMSFGDELDEQLADAPPPRVRLPKSRKVPAPTPVAIESASSAPSTEEPRSEEPQPLGAAEPTIVQDEAIAVPDMPLLIDAVDDLRPEGQPASFEDAFAPEGPVAIDHVSASAPEERQVEATLPIDDPWRFEEPRRFEERPVAAEFVPGPLEEEDDRLPAFLEPPAPVVPPSSPAHSSVWPIGVAAAIGIAIGFGVGYTVAIRGRIATQPPIAASVSPAPAVAPPVAPAQPVEVPSVPAPQPSAPSTQVADAAPSAVPAAPKEAPPSLPALGRVLVRSMPSGARVVVDGKDRGQTPVAIEDLAAGEHRVRVVRDGFTAAERRVVVTSSRPSQILSVPLAREPVAARKTAAAPVRADARPAAEAGTLVVESRPTGATVLVDGRRAGATPLSLGDVRAGTHTIQLERDGYRTWSASVVVAGGEQNRVTASLEK